MQEKTRREMAAWLPSGMVLRLHDNYSKQVEKPLVQLPLARALVERHSELPPDLRLGRMLVVNNLLLPAEHNRQSIDTVALTADGRAIVVEAKNEPRPSDLKKACEQLVGYLNALAEVSEKPDWFRHLYEKTYDGEHSRWARENRFTWDFEIKVAMALGLDPLQLEDWQQKLRSSLKYRDQRQERVLGIIATNARPKDPQALQEILEIPWREYGWKIRVLHVVCPRGSQTSEIDWIL